MENAFEGLVWLTLHAVTTVRLIHRLLQDGRVGAGLKVLFVALLSLIGIAELAPDAGIALGSVLLPGIGPIFGLGADTVLDWTLVLPLLLAFVRLAPRAVVVEHLEDLRGRKKTPGAHVIDGSYRWVG
jgi:hypothetical protein